MNNFEEQMRITKLGNPAKPNGEEGKQLLERMNESHFEVTGWALGHWNINSNDNILDIGCGGGATLKRMSNDIVEGHLTGIDYSHTSVNVSTSNNLEDVQRGKMKIIEGSVESLPFEENYFDKIITVESFYFWPNHLENLKEVLRVLKVDGEFLLVADIYNKEGLDDQTLNNIKEFNLYNPTTLEFYTLLSDAGFRNIKIYTRENTSWICVKGQK